MKKIILNLKNKTGELTDWSDSSITYSDSSQFKNKTISVGLEGGVFAITISSGIEPDGNFIPSYILPILYRTDIIYCQYAYAAGGIVLSFFNSEGAVDLEQGTTDLILTLDYLEAAEQ